MTLVASNVKPMQVFKTLPGRMIASILGLTLSFGALMMISVLYLAGQIYKDQFVNSVRGRVFDLSEIVAQDPSPARLKQMFQGILLARRIVYAEFTPFVEGRPVAAPMRLSTVQGAQFNEDLFFGEHDDGVYYIAAPVMAKKDQKLGELRLGFDEDLISAQLAHITQRSLVFALVYLWALLLMSAALAMRMANPIRTLQKGARQIASGLVDQELRVSTNLIEISELAGDLEYMRKELVSHSQKLAASEARYSAIIKHAADAIVTLDQNMQIEGFNLAAEALFGFSEKEMINAPFSRLLADATDLPELTGPNWRERFKNMAFVGRRADGRIFPLSLAASSFSSIDSTLITLIAHDISDRVAFEQEMAGLAFYDTLTRLPNRKLFNDRLTQALALARRSDSLLAVFFLDLDGFKAVNDVYGHHTGDHLLIAVAARLKSILRASDTVARRGGDEFTLILPDIKRIEDIRLVAEKIIASIAKPFRIGEHVMQISTSLGISCYPIDDSSVDKMIEHADSAMYYAKKGGKNSYRVYVAEMLAGAAERHEQRYQVHNVE